MSKRERLSGRPALERRVLGFAMPHTEKTRGPDIPYLKRWLADVRDDPWFRINPVPMMSRAFKEVSGLQDVIVKRLQYGYRFEDGTAILPATWLKLQHTVERIERGELIFVGVPARTLRYDAVALMAPDPLPPAQPKLTARAAYDYWAPCRSCAGRRYVGLVLGGADWAACYTCLPPVQYRAVGAAISTRRLALDMVEK